MRCRCKLMMMVDVRERRPEGENRHNKGSLLREEQILT